MSSDIPESDWKLFRQLHPVAVGRYCEKVLGEIQRTTADSRKTAHERYLAIYKLVQKRDKELGRGFDDMRRSTAVIQLGIIYSYGVITEEELSRFTERTRDSVLFLSGKSF